MSTGPPTKPLLIALALGIVYVVWGSTYLFIRIMVVDMPPMLSAGGRYLGGALVLGAVLCLRSGARRLRVTSGELAGCALLGLLLPALGNGVVTIAEHRGAPSGITALLIAAVPLWVMVYRLASGDRPGRWTVAGVLLGFGGLSYLVLATGVGGPVPVGAALLVVAASIAWSFGSWFQPRLRLPRDPFVTTVWEMVFGGAILAVAGLAMGEQLHLGSYSAASWWAWTYLVVIGSVVAFSAYVWVLANAPISLVATYAYVNPVVAVFLGWLVLAEPVTTPVVLGGAVVVASVAVVVGSERRPRRTRGFPAGEPETART
ncbi:MAG TPA: EamA family transporter [Nocardioidaceae bacterium]|nr:EamA family transporter [Nocardioidaceae bacterium]